MQKKVVDWKQRLKGQDNLAQFIRGSGGSLIARIVASGIGYAYLILLTNLLGPAEWGDYAYAISWLTNLSLFGKFGFNKSSTRFLAMYVAQKEWPLLRGYLHYSQATMYRISLVLAGVSAILLYLFREPFQQFFEGDAFYHCLLIALAILPFLAHLEVAEGILDGYRRVITSQIPMRIMRPAILGLIVAAVYFLTAFGRNETGEFLTAETTMLINLTAVLLALGTALFILRSALPAQARGIEPRYEKKVWFGTSRDMLLTSSFNLLLVQADVTMLGLMIGTEAAGIYTNASRVALLLIIALTAVNAMLQPLAASLYAEKKQEELQRIVSIGAIAIFAISIVGSVVLYFGADFIISLFGDEEYMAGVPVLRILIVGQLFNAFAGPSVLLLNMTGHQRDAARIMAGGAVLNFVLNGILIALIGLEGAAYASVITNIAWNLAATAIVWNRLRIFTMALWFPRRKN